MSTLDKSFVFVYATHSVFAECKNTPFLGLLAAKNLLNEEESE